MLKNPKEEHRLAVDTAQDALKESEEKLKRGKERLNNALKRYNERGKVDGHIKLI